MKKNITLLFVLALSLFATQTFFAQKTSTREASRCIDCEPPPPTCNSNPIDNPTFYVQQQYRDFLYRNPTGAELANDVAPLNSCLLYADFACYNTERVKM